MKRSKLQWGEELDRLGRHIHYAPTAAGAGWEAAQYREVQGSVLDKESALRNRASQEDAAMKGFWFPFCLGAATVGLVALGKVAWEVYNYPFRKEQS